MKPPSAVTAKVALHARDGEPAAERQCRGRRTFDRRAGIDERPQRRDLVGRQRARAAERRARHVADVAVGGELAPGPAVLVHLVDGHSLAPERFGQERSIVRRRFAQRCLRGDDFEGLPLDKALRLDGSGRDASPRGPTRAGVSRGSSARCGVPSRRCRQARAPCRERPCQRAAKKRDDVAPSHPIELHVCPQVRPGIRVRRWAVPPRNQAAIPESWPYILRQPRGGRRRSWNQTRYSDILARCEDGACFLHVDASSLFSGAPQRSSTQSLTL